MGRGFMKKRSLITEADVRNAASSGVSVLRIPSNAIITPLAVDVSHSAGVRFELVDEDSTGAPQGLAVAIAVTKDAVALKRAVFDVTRGRGIEIIELHAGLSDIEAAVETVKQVAGRHVPFGIILDATGIRSSMIANRFEGIRAVNALEARHARIARSRFDSNLLTLGAEFLTPHRAGDIVAAFLETTYAGTGK